MGNLQFYMKKDSKTIIIFYVFFAIAVTLGILYIDSTFGDLSFNILPTAATYLETERNVPLESKIIFDVMADVKNYSHILPQNIKNVTIIEINKNTVPNVCFQNPCTTTIPCYVDPEEPIKYKQIKANINKIKHM